MTVPEVAEAAREAEEAALEAEEAARLGQVRRLSRPQATAEAESRDEMTTWERAERGHGEALAAAEETVALAQVRAVVSSAAQEDHAQAQAAAAAAKEKHALEACETAAATSRRTWRRRESPWRQGLRAHEKPKVVEKAVYTHADGRRELVEVVAKYAEDSAGGGGYAMHIPSLARERDVMPRRLDRSQEHCFYDLGTFLDEEGGSTGDDGSGNSARPPDNAGSGRVLGGGGTVGLERRWGQPPARAAAPLPRVVSPLSSRVGTDPADLPHLPLGWEVGPSPEERSAAAAAETAEAAKMSASVAAATFAAKLPMTASQSNNPDVVHPSHVLLRYLMGGAGAYRSNLCPEAYCSDLYQQVVFAKLRDAYQTEVEYNLRHQVTLGMVVHCLRTSFGRLHLEDFKKVDRADILKAPVVLMGGGKFTPAPEPSEDVEELYGCAQRVARFLSLMFHHEVGAAYQEFLDAVYELHDVDPSIDNTDFKELLLGGLRRMEHEAQDLLAATQATAEQLGRLVLGAGMQGLQVLRDILWVPGKQSGASTWVAPWDCLRPNNPKGVLARFLAKHQEQVQLATLAAAGERLKRKPRTAEARTKGRGEGSTVTATGTHPLTTRERVRGRAAVQTDPQSRAICLDFLSHRGCQRALRCPRQHCKLPTAPPDAAQLALADLGGWSGAVEISTAEAPAARRKWRQLLAAANVG